MYCVVNLAVTQHFQMVKIMNLNLIEFLVICMYLFNSLENVGEFWPNFLVINVGDPDSK